MRGGCSRRLLRSLQILTERKSTMNPDHIRIRIIIDDPCAPAGSLPQERWLNLSRAEFRDAFTPLPRDRELPWATEERQREAEQREARRRAAAIVTRELAPAIVDAIAKIDTINGYSPQEWEKIHR